MAASFYRQIGSVFTWLTAAASEMDVNLNTPFKIHIHFIFASFLKAASDLPISNK